MSYEERVRALEEEGCTRSDAQAVVDAEDLRALYAMQVAAESLSVPSEIRYQASVE